MRNSTLLRNMVMTIMAGLVLLAGAAAATAQEKIGGIVEFDKTVHNFGDVMLSDGPLSCTFTLKNTGEKAFRFETKSQNRRNSLHIP